MLCYAMLCYAILYYTILYYTILYYTILYYTILYYTILYYTILYCTVLYCTVLCSTVPYRTVLCCAVLCRAVPYHTVLPYRTIPYHTDPSRAITRVLTANRQFFVHSWRPIMMNVHYIMITNNILTKRILINRIFHFRRCQIILWWQSTEPSDRTCFGCFSSGHNLSDDYGIPTCNSNDVTRSAVGLSQTASRWKQMRTHAPKWPLLPDRETFCRYFDLGFHYKTTASKPTTRQNGLT